MVEPGQSVPFAELVEPSSIPVIAVICALRKNGLSFASLLGSTPQCFALGELSMKREWIFSGAVLLIVLVFSGPMVGATGKQAAGHQNRLSPEFHGSLPHGKVNVIVQYR